MTRGERAVTFKALMELELETQAAIVQLAETSVSTRDIKATGHPELVDALRQVPKPIFNAYKETIPQMYFN